jgi:hypothetical protein
MPQEDPQELAGRTQQWVDDWQPRNAIEHELVSRAARLSFLLERLERAETAHLARRARMGSASLAGASSKRMEQVAELARKLLYHQGQRFAMQAGPPWPDNPAAFLRGLEETLEGCRWLLERWRQMRNLQAVGAAWTLADQHRLMRLLGKEGAEAINDPELNRIFLAWEVIADGMGQTYWKARHDSISLKDPGLGYHQVWREIVPRPVDEAEAQAVLDGIIAREIGRLEAILAEYEMLAAAEAAEIADRAAFDGTAEFDRLRRHQTARGRELLRTIDLLRKLRPEPVEPAEPAAELEQCDLAHGRPCRPYEDPLAAPDGPDLPSEPTVDVADAAPTQCGCVPAAVAKKRSIEAEVESIQLTDEEDVAARSQWFAGNERSHVPTTSPIVEVGTPGADEAPGIDDPVWPGSEAAPTRRRRQPKPPHVTAAARS